VARWNGGRDHEPGVELRRKFSVHLAQDLTP
jgi:hypothetical protein